MKKEYIYTVLYTWNRLFCIHVYMITHEPYFLHAMHCFASVCFMFFTAEICTLSTNHMYTRIHIYHTLYMKCTVLLVFSCVFNADTCIFGSFYMFTRIYMYHTLFMEATVVVVFLFALLQIQVLLVHFTCIQEYTCTILYS
jgi:hypothetical protein